MKPIVVKFWTDLRVVDVKYAIRKTIKSQECRYAPNGKREKYCSAYANCYKKCHQYELVIRRVEK